MPSMKRTAAELKARKTEMKSPGLISNEESYPYGLTLRLDNETLKKLGMKSLPKVGASLTISGKAEVKSVRSSERQGGKDDREVELQVTDLYLNGGSKIRGTGGNPYDRDRLDSVVEEMGEED